MVKLGVRCGAEMRKRAAAIRKTKTAYHICPSCGKKKVKRVSNSIWACRSCGSKFAGGAFSLNTPIGDTGRRLIDDLSRTRKQ
ncbi:MAG: 50S ribosomal protein L37ae [Candidatus Micrarchaeota archaeon]